MRMISAAMFLVVMACSVSATKREVALEPVAGSGVRATAYLEEVLGKSGRVISARMEANDPSGRALVGALVEGRCARLGKHVSSIQLLSVPGHLGGASPSRLSELAGSHAVAVFEDTPGESAPLACADL
jgi:hypothetical protein